jgi:4-diphosphocytidyl-2C-methyl-D-erythritol kinase
LFELDEPRARAALFNRLEPAALSILPELRAWRDLLDHTEAGHFRQSGSGSSFFGLFREREPALVALARIAARARAQGLRQRGAWVTRPAGHGARLVPRT